MKRYTTAFLVFAVLTIVIGGHFTFKDSPRVQAAAENAVVQNTEAIRLEMTTPEATSGQEIKKKSEYILPYPGILQNHPLYFLKEFRDKIIETLIVDPLRKSEFFLLQSDKWIAATSSLIAQDQIEIAQRVLDAASLRMKDAVSQLNTIKAGGREIPSGSIDKLDNALEKHLELLDEFSIEKKVSTDTSRQLYLAAQDELMKLRQ